MAVLNSAKCLMVPDGKLFVLWLRRTDVQIVIVDIDDYDQLQELRERERGRGRGGDRLTDGRSINSQYVIYCRSEHFEGLKNKINSCCCLIFWSK